MSPEGWRSRTGAPWPYIHEYEQGCTYEHVGYHLTWLCAIFGPVENVTAFSKVAIPDKTKERLSPPDTPDFSVACLNFRSGVVARVTCSIGAPYDHRMRIVGNKGMLTVDTYRDYRCPVYLEPFTKLSMNARKAISVRRSNLLQWMFGVGGKRLEMLRLAPPGTQRVRRRRWSIGGMFADLKRNQLGQQDKAIGIAELADALRKKREFFPPPDFTLHLTELTLKIQNAGVNGASHRLATTFKPLAMRPETADSGLNYGGKAHPLTARVAERLLDRMHRH